MKYEVSSWGDGDETDVIGITDSRDEARDLILNFVKKMVGKPVPYLTVHFAYNGVRSALIEEKVTHIAQAFDGHWTLIWHDSDEIKDKLFFVYEDD